MPATRIESLRNYRQSRYGIHDLSLTELDATNQRLCSICPGIGIFLERSASGMRYRQNRCLVTTLTLIALEIGSDSPGWTSPRMGDPDCGRLFAIG